MKTFRVLITIFLTFFIATHLFSQVPRFNKMSVGTKGEKLYMPGEPIFDLSYSQDSSRVYAGESEINNVLYSAIVVEFKVPIDGDAKVLQGVLVSYLDYLTNSALKLTEKTEPGYGHTLPSNANAHGILVYGKDENNFEYTFKGWIDNNMLAVLFVSYNGELNQNIQDMFLNGFRFPEK